VNCAAIPESLIESGCSAIQRCVYGSSSRGNAGSHRSASAARVLDEIGDMPLTLQTRCCAHWKNRKSASRQRAVRQAVVQVLTNTAASEQLTHYGRAQINPQVELDGPLAAERPDFLSSSARSNRVCNVRAYPRSRRGTTCRPRPERCDPAFPRDELP